MENTKVVNVRVKYIRPEYKNLKAWCEDENNVYIARRGVVLIDKKRYPLRDSPFANPYKVGRDGSREEVIEKYRERIQQKIKDDEINIEQLQSLVGKNLGCWCAPKYCHGDVLLEIIRNAESSRPLIHCEK